MAAEYVTSALVVVRLQSGQFAHIYSGAPLPEDADPEHVKQLRDLKMVGAKAAGKSAPKPDDKK